MEKVKTQNLEQEIESWAGYANAIIEGFTNPKIANSYVTSVPVACELLKRDPEYACVIADSLLMQPSIVLYAVRTAGNFSNFVNGRMLDDAYVTYNYNKTNKLEHLLKNNTDFYHYFRMIERLVAGINRDKAMELVDKINEYSESRGYFPEFNWPLPDPMRYALSDISTNLLYNRNSLLVTNPDIFIQMLIDSLNQQIKYHNPEVQYNKYINSLVECAIEKYNEQASENPSVPYFASGNIEEKTGIITDKKCAQELLSCDPRAVSIINPALLNDWEVALFLINNNNTVSCQPVLNTRDYYIDGRRPQMASLLPLEKAFEPEFYNLFNRLENVYSGGTREKLVELIHLIIEYKHATGSFPEIPPKGVLIEAKYTRYNNQNCFDIVATMDAQIDCLIKKIHRDKHHILTIDTIKRA